jgi:hypothetical protein
MKTLLLLVIVTFWIVGASGCRWCEEWFQGRREVVVPTPAYPVMQTGPAIGSPCAVPMGTTGYCP